MVHVTNVLSEIVPNLCSTMLAQEGCTIFAVVLMLSLPLGNVGINSF
jgi:hypothetical protein